MAADLDPHDLVEVRRRVIDPVLAAVLRPGELDDVALAWEGSALTVRLVARGEFLMAFLGDDDGGSWDARAVAEHLHNSVTDDLPTTGFAWGEQREARFEVPGPPGG